MRFPYTSAETVKQDSGTTSSGTKYNGWVWNSAGTKCYHYTNGVLDKNTWMKGTGSWSKYWFYCGSDGAAVTNQWLKLNGKYYYFNNSGMMVTND